VLDLTWDANGVTATLAAARDTEFDLSAAGRELLSATVDSEDSPIGAAYRRFRLAAGQSLVVRYK
jgi:hypothetical protein